MAATGNLFSINQPQHISMRGDGLDMLFYRPFPSHRNSIMLWREGFFSGKEKCKDKRFIVRSWKVVSQRDSEDVFHK